jgi:predicted Rossmann fold nucleotide-binding protein DprA/Smf involved in DNA uptake
MLAVLAEDALPVDELSARFLRPVPEILAVLTTLELHGEVVRLPGLRFRRAA